MRTVLAAALALALLGAASAFADDAAMPGRRASKPSKEPWEFAITAYPTQVRGGDNTTSAIAVADRGSLHLEARYGYETKDSRSAFLGWTFSGGETIAWEVTPLMGGAWGPISAFVPGVEASVSWGRFDFYVEAEFVRDKNNSADSYNYAWSELGFKAAEWLRIGAVGQRTKLYGGDREFQRGPFVQVTWKRATFGAFWFNPGSSEQVFVGAIGATF
jgi:hypothetical protein